MKHPDNIVQPKLQLLSIDQDELAFGPNSLTLESVPFRKSKESSEDKSEELNAGSKSIPSNEAYKIEITDSLSHEELKPGDPKEIKKMESKQT